MLRAALALAAALVVGAGAARHHHDHTGHHRHAAAGAKHTPPPAGDAFPRFQQMQAGVEGAQWRSSKGTVDASASAAVTVGEKAQEAWALKHPDLAEKDRAAVKEKYQAQLDALVTKAKTVGLDDDKDFDVLAGRLERLEARHRSRFGQGGKKPDKASPGAESSKKVAEAEYLLESTVTDLDSTSLGAELTRLEQSESDLFGAAGEGGADETALLVDKIKRIQKNPEHGDSFMADPGQAGLLKIKRIQKNPEHGDSFMADPGQAGLLELRGQAHPVAHIVPITTDTGKEGWISAPYDGDQTGR